MKKENGILLRLFYSAMRVKDSIKDGGESKSKCSKLVSMEPLVSRLALLFSLSFAQKTGINKHLTLSLMQK
jgi:hypothetical protein